MMTNLRSYISARKTVMLFCVAFSVSRGVAQQGRLPTLPIIPMPAHVEGRPGTLDASHGLSLSAAPKDEGITSATAYLKHLLAGTHDPELQTEKRGFPALVFVGRPRHGMDDESYSLDVSARGVRIEASSSAGFLYGAISLWQVLDALHGVLPCVHIEDQPRFRWRGLMLDSARHMQSEEAILRILDEMARHKLNTFHWHLTDDQGWRVEIKRYPKLTSVGATRGQTMPPYQSGSSAPTGPYAGFYSQEQIRRIVAYAKARNITIVPEIELPGHASAALAAYPEFGSGSQSLPATPVGWGIYPNLYNVDDATFTFIENILTEVMQLFPGQYIHIGGDEAIKDQWKANPDLQAKMRSLGIKSEDEMQSWFVHRIDQFLTAHNRRVIGWDEILHGGLSPNAAVMSWHGVEGGLAAARQGHDAVLTPHNPLYLNYRQSEAIDEPAGRDPLNTLEAAYNFDPAPKALTPAEQSHILGVQGSLWTEYVLTEDRVQHMLFPRAVAIAEIGWSPVDNRDYPDFLRRLNIDMERSHAFGIHPAESVFEVRALVQADTKGTSASLDLSTQAKLGTIRYTLDGSAVTARSPSFKSALSLPLPSTLRAQAFDGDTPLGEPIERVLTFKATLRRDSRELDNCKNAAGIQLEQDPPRNQDRPVFRVVYSNPCWIYKAAKLDQFSSLEVGVGSIPYIFRSQTRPMVMPPVPHPEESFLDVHMDTCKGKLLTSVPLAPAYRKDGVTTLSAGSLSPASETHDLCFSVRSPDPNTVWLLNYIQPLPRH